MKKYIRELLKKYRQKGILIDTNILLLWFIGGVNRSRISKFKRTNQFIPEDYDLLLEILSYFTKIVTTPNILTEVNSLANQLGEPERSQCFSVFAQGVFQLDEFCIESTTVVNNTKFTKFGLTDCGISNLASGDKYLVLTDDFPLSNYLQKSGIDTINFNNIRNYGWG